MTENNSTKFFKTLYLSDLKGQNKLWMSSIVKTCHKVDAIVQFGNLIGCNDYVRDKTDYGPNEGLLHHTTLYAATKKWVQLAGPNEIVALNDPNEWTNAISRHILREAWISTEPTMFVAAAFNGRLLTHGGMTYGEWISLGKPSTPEETAMLLNEKYVGTLYQGPCLKLGNPPNFSANPIWADPLQEFLPSWVTAPEPMPFDQMHASASLANEVGRAMMSEEHSILPYIDVIRHRKWGSIETIQGRDIVSVDLPLPDQLITSLPRPHSLFIEKIAV